MPECTPLFIDKLSLTLPIRNRESQEYLDEILPHGNSIQGYRLIPKGWSPYYRFAKTIAFSDECEVVLQYSPTRYRNRWLTADDPEAMPENDIEPVGRRRRLRIEWNPSHMAASPEFLSDFHAILESILGESMRSEFEEARITRIDLATDVRQLPIERIAVSRSDDTVSSAIYLGRDGRHQTIYLGAKDSDVRYCIYDKRAQSRGRVRSPAFARTRIEARIKKFHNARELLNFPNPFLGLTIREYVALEIGGRRNADYHWEWFLDSCKSRGLQAATALAPGRSRYNLRRRILERTPPLWWNPEELWRGLPAAIRRLGLWDD